MTYSDKVSKIMYGGDYNPEQWPKETWQDDLRLLKEAHIDILTLNVFSWARLQPDENNYNFDKLDCIMKLVHDNGFKVCMATSTGAHPAWMAKRHPDILRVEFNGIRRKFGGRHNSCPNSPTYRMYSKKLASKLAERYQNYDNIVAWHVSNEYGGECYCENCERAFQGWLKQKYQTLEEVNRVWNTSFWGHTFYDWDEIVVPNLQSEHFAYERTQFQGISLDYRRFFSESLLECYNEEAEAIREITPNIPITTNLMGSYKMLDYKKWAQKMDFISWDNYPDNGDSPACIAFHHDLMRGIKGGEPFVLMEQTPSVTNWLSYNALKRPKVMRLWSYQAVAHGADAVMFFQMKRSIGACEKLHGAVIDHVGNDKTRVFREVTELGEELEKLEDFTLGGKTYARVALYFDWDNWWAIEYSAGPSCELKYKDEILNYYQALYDLNVSVDIIGTPDELDKYQIVIAPILYMTPKGYDEKIRKFVKQGGIFITTFFSGIVDEHDLVITGGYPGKLRDILGIWVEESDALPQGAKNRFFYQGCEYPARLLCDISHLETAKSLAEYEEDFYAQTPVVTKNDYGKGQAYYVGTRSDSKFYREFLSQILREQNIKGILPPKEGLEVTLRENETGRYIFLLNHKKESISIRFPEKGEELLSRRKIEAGEILEVEAKDVRIIRGDKI